MDVVLVHDPWLLPVDLYRPLQEAGHRVVSHGAELPDLGEFLQAMRWAPEAFVIDHRGRDDLLDEAGRWLAETAPWHDVPRIDVGEGAEPVDPERVLAALRSTL